MIEHVIDKLGTQQDEKNLSKYKDEFGKYAERHVFECPSEVGTVSKGLAKMFVTLDQTFESCTVRNLELFVDNLRKTEYFSRCVFLTLSHYSWQPEANLSTPFLCPTRYLSSLQ